MITTMTGFLQRSNSSASFQLQQQQQQQRRSTTSNGGGGNSNSRRPSSPFPFLQRGGRLIPRVNVVVACGLMALLLQVWNVRSSFGLHNYSITTTTPSKDCQDIYQLLQDTPLLRGTRNGGAITESSASMAMGPYHNNNNSNNNNMNDDIPLPKTYTNSSMAVIVLSRRNAWKVRKAIRDTWAKDVDNVYFVLGQGCTIPTEYRGVDEGGNSYCKVRSKPFVDNGRPYMNATMHHALQERFVTRQLKREQEEFQDLLVMPHTVDMYRTLPAKLKYA
jgi:hypothetical protein